MGYNMSLVHKHCFAFLFHFPFSFPSSSSSSSIFPDSFYPYALELLLWLQVILGLNNSLTPRFLYIALIRQLLGTSFQTFYEKHKPTGATLCCSSHCLCLVNCRYSLAHICCSWQKQGRQIRRGITGDYGVAGRSSPQEQKLEIAFPKFLNVINPDKSIKSMRTDTILLVLLINDEKVKKLAPSPKANSQQQPAALFLFCLVSPGIKYVFCPVAMTPTHQQTLAGTTVVTFI